MGAMTRQESVTVAGELYDQLSAIVEEWDPYGLSSSGEIAGEFSDEVWALLRKLPEVTSVDAVAVAVAGVFGHSFGSDRFGEVACRAVADRIYSWWSNGPFADEADAGRAYDAARATGEIAVPFEDAIREIEGDRHAS